MKKNISNFFKNKKNILIGVVCSTIILVPIIAVSSNLINNSNNQILSADLKRYVDANTSLKEGENTTWSINYNGESKTFDNPVDLRLFIDKNIIKESTHVTSKDLNDYANDIGYIENINEIISNNALNQIDDFSKITKEIFLGKNDQIKKDYKDALDSFYEEKNGYYFNGIFFENKLDLNSYITKHYFNSNNKQFNSIVLKGPDNQVSSPININDEDAINQIENAIDSMAKKSLYYINSKNNEKIEINDDVINNPTKIDSSDLEYIHVQSNKGESRYLIDNDKTDEGNLIGPYFYNGVLDVNSFMDKSMWFKSKNVTKEVYYESIIDQQIGVFFTNILNDSNQVAMTEQVIDGSTPTLFRTAIQVTLENNRQETKTVDLDTAYMEKLKNKSKRIYDELLDLNNFLSNGKKTNTFFKIPIYYSFILQRIVNYNVGQSLLNDTIAYFTSVCDSIQDKIEVIVGPNKDLLIRSSDNKKFVARDFFQIGNPEYDINTSTEYFLNEFKTWDKLLIAITTYNFAVTNINLLAGLGSFEMFYPQELIDSKIISLETYHKNEMAYKRIFDVFSTLNYDEMILQLKKYDTLLTNVSSFEYEMILATTFSKYQGLPYDYLLKSIGIENTLEHNHNLSLIENEIVILNETGNLLEGGFLIDLYSDDKKVDRLSKYMNIVNKESNVDYYKVYMGFMIESRNEQYFNAIDGKELPTWYDLLKVVNRITSSTLAGSALLANTINSIYKGTKSAALKKRNPRNSIGKTNSSRHSINRISNLSRNIKKRGRAKGKNKDEIDINGLNNESNDIKNQVVTNNLPTKPNKRYPILYKNDGQVIASPKVIHPNIDNNLLITQSGKSQELLKTIEIVDLPKFHTGNSDWANWTEEERLWRRNDKFDVKHLNLYSEKLLDRHEWVLLTKSNFPYAVIQGEKNFTGKFIIRKSTDWVFDDVTKKHAQINFDAGVIIWENNQVYEFERGAGNKLKDELRKRYQIDPKFEVHKQPANGGNSINIEAFEKLKKMQMDFDNWKRVNNKNNKNKKPAKFPNIKLDKKGNIKIDKPTIEDNSNDPNKIYKNPTLDPNVVASNSGDVTGKPLSKATSSQAILKNHATKSINHFNNALTTFSIGMSMLEIAIFIMDIIKVEHSIDYYTYVTRDGTEFIWDGGESVSKYLGFYTETTKDITGMKLLKPIAITLPSIQEYYFYSELKYYNQEQMKVSQLIDMKNNPNSIVGFNFSKLWYMTTNPLIENAESKIDLKNKVIANLGITFDETTHQPIFDNFDRSSKYISDVNYSFSNGLFISNGDDPNAIATKVIENIRATKIARIPTLINGYAHELDNNFIYPGKYWDRNTNSVIENKTRAWSGYLIDNSANYLKNKNNDNFNPDNYVIPNKQHSEYQSSKNLKSLFDEKVFIKSKIVLIDDLIKTNKYSKISSEFDCKKIYSLKINNDNWLHFADRNKANSYAYNIMGFKKNAKYMYYFDNKFFNSKNNVYKYAIQNQSKFNF